MADLSDGIVIGHISVEDDPPANEDGWVHHFYRVLPEKWRRCRADDLRFLNGAVALALSRHVFLVVFHLDFISFRVFFFVLEKGFLLLVVFFFKYFRRRVRNENCWEVEVAVSVVPQMKRNEKGDTPTGLADF